MRNRIADVEGSRLTDGRAVLERLELRELVQALTHACSHSFDYCRPFLGRLPPPLALLVCVPGRLDR